MHFYKKDGRQELSLSDDLVLTRGKLITYTSKSATPFAVYNGRFAQNIDSMGFRCKLRVAWLVIAFIWSKPNGTIKE